MVILSASSGKIPVILSSQGSSSQVQGATFGSTGFWTGGAQVWLTDPCVSIPPGPGDAAEPRAAVEGAGGGQPQPVARALTGPAGPRAGAALPLGPPDAHPLGHGEALAAPAAARAPADPGTRRCSLEPGAPRLEPPPAQGPRLRSAPGPALPCPRGLGAREVAGPQAPEPAHGRPGLGVGAGLGRRPSRPTAPAVYPPAPEASGRVRRPPQPARLRLVRPREPRGEVRAPAGARAPAPAPDAVRL